jgi:hypothetical protein
MVLREEINRRINPAAPATDMPESREQRFPVLRSIQEVTMQYGRPLTTIVL